jgi:hypothetical protein
MRERSLRWTVYESVERSSRRSELLELDRSFVDPAIDERVSVAPGRSGRPSTGGRILERPGEVGHREPGLVGKPIANRPIVLEIATIRPRGLGHWGSPRPWLIGGPGCFPCARPLAVPLRPGTASLELPGDGKQQDADCELSDRMQHGFPPSRVIHFVARDRRSRNTRSIRSRRRPGDLIEATRSDSPSAL